MLKIVLLAYSRGLISSRRIEAVCLHHVQFIAISGDSQPSYTHIAKFVRELGGDIQALVTRVLLTCERLGLIGRQMFVIDGVKLPANASKERSGAHTELAHPGPIGWTRPRARASKPTNGKAPAVMSRRA